MIKALKKIILPFVKPELQKVNKLRNLHNGESCYLIGNGITLKWFDLEAFSDKISISCGSLPFHNDFHKLNVKYMSYIEPWFFYPKSWSIRNPFKITRNVRQNAFINAIQDNPDITFFLNLSNYFALNSKNIKFLYKEIYDKNLNQNFISKRINSFHGAIRTMILMAIYMGFKECILVGFDYTHLPSRNLHFYEKGEGQFIPQPNYNEDFFTIAKEFINIKTITLDGKSEYLEAITYEDYTGKKPFFRENKDLLKVDYLEMLATWKGYSIY